MKNLIKLIICILVVLTTHCKTGTDCENLYLALKYKADSGYFHQARRMSDSLKMYCRGNENLIRKSDSILEIAERIWLDFTLTEEQFKSRVEKYYGTVSDSMLTAWDRKKWIEWRMIDGEKKYFNRAVSNLVLLRKFYEEKEKQDSESAADPDMIARLKHTEEVIKLSGNKTDPVLPVKMKIMYTITVMPDIVPDGEVLRCWLPIPNGNHSRQQGFELLSASAGSYTIAPDSAIHRTLYMEGIAKKGLPTIFSISYSYTSSAQYFNPEELKILPYDKSSDLYKKYTSEQLPNICFSDNIRHLADEITAPGDDPPAIVRKIYLWFKENIPWTGALEYSIMPNIPEYVYENRRGDCGMQTFLYMSMLRYKGIPVRWQSGWQMTPGGKNLHDWCEVYYEGPGWIPSDVTYDLQYSDNRQLKEFFLSGIDSYRLIVNDGVAGSLYPEKKFLRSEPYDFQRGEVEWKGGNLYFDKWDYNMQIEYLK